MAALDQADCIVVDMKNASIRAVQCVLKQSAQLALANSDEPTTCRKAR